MAAQDYANAIQNCGSTMETNNSPVTSVLKRPCGSPTLYTPHREEERVPLRELVSNDSNEVPRVTLFNQPSMNTAPEGESSDSTNAQMAEYSVNIIFIGTFYYSKEKWTKEELRALTEFVFFHTTGDKWPTHKEPEFWRAADVNDVDDDDDDDVDDDVHDDNVDDVDDDNVDDESYLVQ